MSGLIQRVQEGFFTHVLNLRKDNKKLNSAVPLSLSTESQGLSIVFPAGLFDSFHNNRTRGMILKRGNLFSSGLGNWHVSLQFVGHRSHVEPTKIQKGRRGTQTYISVVKRPRECMPILFFFFSIMVCYRILNIVLCAQQDLVAYPFPIKRFASANPKLPGQPSPAYPPPLATTMYAVFKLCSCQESRRIFYK